MTRSIEYSRGTRTPNVQMGRARCRTRIIGAAAGLALLLPGVATGNTRFVDDHLFVLTTDYTTGSSSTVDLPSPWTTQFDVEPVGADPTARYAYGLIYVVNRLGGDNVQVIDPETYETVIQFSTGPGTNPQDIALVTPTRAYVSLYNADTLLELDPTTGSILEEISLAAFADGDGLPESARLHYRAPYLYVQVQRLDRSQFYEPVGDSYLVVVDTRDNTLVDVDPDIAGPQGIALEATNPNGPMEIDLRTGARLLVPCAGSFSDPTDGGLESVDLDSWTTNGIISTGTDLGGDLLRFTQFDGESLFAIVSNSSFVTCLVKVSLETGDVVSTVYCSPGFDLADCRTTAEGWLYLADRNFTDPGIRVFDADTGAALASSVIPVGLPPVELLVIRPETSDVPPPADLSAPIHPNPSAGNVQWSLAQEGTQLRLSIVDVLGRTVLHLPEGATRWDGRDLRGENVPSGAYWLAIESAGRLQTVPLRILR